MVLIKSRLKVDDWKSVALFVACIAIRGECLLVLINPVNQRHDRRLPPATATAPAVVHRYVHRHHHHFRAFTLAARLLRLGYHNVRSFAFLASLRK